MKWLTPTRGSFTFEEMIEEIKRYVLKDSNYEYEVVVGTDSQYHAYLNQIRYVPSVSIVKKGKGGQYYYKHEYIKNSAQLRDKIWEEVVKSYNNIEALYNALQDVLDKECFVAHIDVGEEGDTKSLIKETKSLFIGAGYRVKIKPYSFGASTVSDRHSK